MIIVHDETRLRTDHAFDNHLNKYTCMAVSASRYLTKLYRLLDDSKQASNAIRAGAYAEERACRYRLSSKIENFQVCGADTCPNDIVDEQRAWEVLVEAQAGIAVLHGMANPQGGKFRGLRGARSASKNAMIIAAKGFCMAFPENEYKNGINRSIGLASNDCSNIFLETVQIDLKNEQNNELNKKIKTEINDWLCNLIFNQIKYNNQTTG